MVKNYPPAFFLRLSWMCWKGGQAKNWEKNKMMTFWKTSDESHGEKIRQTSPKTNLLPPPKKYISRYTKEVGAIPLQPAFPSLAITNHPYLEDDPGY